MKKIIGFLAIIMLVIGSMLIQSSFINRVELFGVIPNLLLVIIVTISLWYGVYIGTTVGFICGFVADSWFDTGLGKYLILFTIISMIVGYFNKNYKKENIVTLIYLVFNMTIVYELLFGIYTVVVTKDMFSIFLLLKVLILSTLYNVVIACAMYYILAFICNKIEDLIVAEDRW